MRRHAGVVLSLLISTCAFGGSVVEVRPLHRGVTPRVAATERGRVTSDAFAGYTPYHNGVTLLCADCHVMHASEQHAYDGSTAAFPRTNVPYDRLLRHADPVDVCLSCHDGMLNIPDVVGVDSNSLTERSAGMFDLPETPNHRGHALGRGLDLEPSRFCSRCHFEGEFATAEVSCLDCHAHHGNDRVRNIQWASAKGSEPQFAMVMRAGATGLAKYERANVGYGYVAGTAREVTNMCIDCHHTFCDDSGGWYTNPDGDDHWNRHPNFNSEWGAVQAVAFPRWMSEPTTASRLPFVGIGAGDFASATTVDPARNAIFCLSCHKAHGSDNSFAMTFDPQTVPKEKGCDQCHLLP